MVHEHIGKISQRKEDSHKGDYGKVAVVAGSKGMTGAAFLSSQAALLSGSGLVTNIIPEALNGIMETKFTEVMTYPVDDEGKGCFTIRSKDEILDALKDADVVALGPGLGTNDETVLLVKSLLNDIEVPVVIDADGLNALEGDLGILEERKNDAILTPHPGEMRRLISKLDVNDGASREDQAKLLAERTGKIVCLKGHRTVVASSSGDLYVNETGNSGMSTGGTGDVLTGMIASFVGQGVDMFSSAVLGVYLHGLAGDIARDKKGMFSLIAGDVLDNIPEAFKKAGI